MERRLSSRQSEDVSLIEVNDYVANQKHMTKRASEYSLSTNVWGADGEAI